MTQNSGDPRRPTYQNIPSARGSTPVILTGQEFARARFLLARVYALVGFVLLGLGLWNGQGGALVALAALFLVAADGLRGRA